MVTAVAEKPELKPELKRDIHTLSMDDLKTLPMPELQKKLGSSADGLTQAEAAKRLAQYGPNEITEPVVRTSEIAARAYELYQQRVHGESQQDQDWLEAEREIRDNASTKKKVA